MASIAKVAAVGRLKAPQALAATLVVKRDKSVGVTSGNYKRGTGGRSSFSGVVATVFGGSGDLGHRTINKLGKTGSQIIVPYRCDAYHIKDIPLMGDLGQILFNKFDLRDDSSIKKVMQYSNVVINTIGREHETRNYTFQDIYVDGPRRIAKFAKEAGVDKFIHVSHLNAPVKSSNLLQQGSRLLAAKYEGEQAVFEEFPDATIIRPADIISEGLGWLNLYNSGVMTVRVPTPVQRFRKRIPLWMGGKEVVKMPLKIGDFTKGVEAIIRSKEAKGKIYQFFGPQAYCMYDLLEFIRNAKLDFSYSYTTDFTPIMAKAKIQASVYLKAGTPVPKISPDRLERETISDQLDEKLHTLQDLGVTPESVLPYIQYCIKTYIDVSRIVDEVGHVPQPPQPTPLFSTMKEDIADRRIAVK